MTQFEKIQKMSIKEMARFFSSNKAPDFPNSPCYICPHDIAGKFCVNSEPCTKEYKISLYEKWLSEEIGE